MPFKISILLPIIALLLSTAVFSQPQLRDLKKAKVHTLEPAPIEWGGKSLPFKNVVVVDSRFDTSKLGYIKRVQYYEKLQTPSSLAETMQQTTNTYPKQANMADAPTLYVFIKHLWLQQASVKELSDQKLSNGYLEDFDVAACNAVLECYMQKDSFYYPLFRLDTMLLQGGKLRKRAEGLLTESFQVALLKLSNINLSKKRKQMTLQEVIAYNNSKKSYPKLQSDTLESGVYLTFQDFLHNRITKKTLEVQWGFTDDLYAVEGKDKNLLLEFWGFSDGQKQYVRLGFNFYELSREGDTYELIGAKALVNVTNHRYRPNAYDPTQAAMAGLSAITNRDGTKTTLLKPMQLNMETGEPY